jgi:RNA polymerase sigma-70 factor (ECF subfamily)
MDVSSVTSSSLPWTGRGLCSPAVGSIPRPGTPLSVRTDDIALVRRVAASDREAFALLYERYSSLVHSICRRVLDDRFAQEEATQDVFLQVWRRADRFDPDRASVGSWLVLLARSRALDQGRRLARRDTPREGVAEEGEELAPDPDPDGLDAACAIAEAMATLPPDQFDAIRLAYFEGLTQTEIAGRLRVPVGTVKGRVRLALARLRTVAADRDLEGRLR